MANGHPRPRSQPHLPRPNIPSPLPIQQQLSYRYILDPHPTPHNPPTHPTISHKTPTSHPTLPSNSHTISRHNSANYYHLESPEVTFIPLTSPPRPIPLHPHVYSNGYICLDLLGASGWSPVQNVESVCMSIQSMLTGNVKAERPPGDEDFVRRNTLRPRDVNFIYEDATV